jgi:DNA-binding CsgD family transcriptional regulator
VVQPLAERANYAYFLGDARRYLRRIGEDVPAFEGCPAGFAAGIAGDGPAAAAAWCRAGNPYEQALEEVAAGDPATVLAGIRRLDTLGATATANRVRRELSRRGMGSVPRGPRSTTRTHPGGLTARQQDVLALLAEGLTTARIAQQLYLSPRTVDNHVAQILARLGVTSRRDAVATARREGWLPAANLSSAAAQSE